MRGIRFVHFKDLWEFLLVIEKTHNNNKLFVGDGGRNLRYSEIRRYVECWREYFDGINIRNQVIILMGEFDADWIITFLGICCSGNIVVPIARVEDYSDVLSNSINESLVLVANEQLGQIFPQDKIRKKINYKKMNDYFSEKEHTVSNLLKDTFLSNKVAIWITTSGTTGKKKIVMLTHKNIVADILHISSIFQNTFSCNDKLLSFLPVNHMFGITVGILMPMFYGARICIVNQFNPIQALRIYDPTVLIAVPTILEKLYPCLVRNEVGTDEVIGRDIRSICPGLKSIVCGSAPIHQSIIMEYQKLGIEVFEGYGATECSPVISCNSRENFKLGSVGRVNISPYCKVKIAENEIIVFGDIVSCEKNVFLTGDLGYVDSEGYLFITGRKKDVLVMKDGNKIFPLEIENSILKYTNKIDNLKLCLGKRNEMSREVLTLLVAPKEMDIHSLTTYKYFQKIVCEYNDTAQPYKRIRKLLLKDKCDECFSEKDKFDFRYFQE